MLARRQLIGAGAALAVTTGLARAADTAPDAPAHFEALSVQEMARALAAKPYTAPASTLPPQLKSLSYDDYRKLRFDPAHALWRDQHLPFQVEFFHLGFLYETRVDIYEVADGVATPIRYRPDWFTQDVVKPAVTDDIGFAGFRVHAPLNRPDYFDEVCAFLGASYFRAVARGETYGLSARGLAIATADPKGEEFPSFRKFWLERPAQGAAALVIHALLDSESAAAAYRFTIRPGEDTSFDIESVIYPRTAITEVGIAPLTSMFLFDANDRSRIDDWRPSVHDSNGLLILNGNGEQVWRPLANPRDLQVSVFGDRQPRGFGLIQRERRFEDYEDLEANYQTRPSAWVEPMGDWGEGAVMLVEIPTELEIHDNIVAFWRPKAPLAPGSQYTLTYRLHWADHAPVPADVAPITRTAIGRAGEHKILLAVIDFAKGRLKPDATPSIDLGCNAGQVVNPVAQANPDTGGWRLSFEIEPGAATVVEMHARLKDESGPATETWLYRWTA